MRYAPCRGWLPQDKRAAICFSVDDIRPASSQDGFDADGDLGLGALGRLSRLMNRQPQLRVTLFVTPDWRLDQLRPTRGLLTRIPLLREHMHWAPLRPRGRFRVDRFPEFVAYLNAMPRADVALHGLSHAHAGPRIAAEFQRESRRACAAALREARRRFEAAGLRHVLGFAPPPWNTLRALCEALIAAGFDYLCSARDLATPVSEEALTNMSGLVGVPLIAPVWVVPNSTDGPVTRAAARERIMHFSTNFQATSSLDRALSIIDAGGLLAIKAHIFKVGGGITMLDGLDLEYCAYIESVCRHISSRYGEGIWWTSFAEFSRRCRMR